jgi:serine/threonine protein kinase/Tfp pilus assembly protein PilF
MPARHLGFGAPLMTPARWEQIKELFHATLAHEPAQRPTFLAQACADDAPLRDEVESLLASHDQAESFIETSASDIAAELLAENQPGLLAGQMVGPFRVAKVLATGGMGEVYLADDTRLGRKVALKLLPAKFTVNTDRVRRFRQEARAVSALNHPNIVTIHEIGQTDSLQFIANEFVDGETLRQRMASVLMKLDEVLDVATQIASALAAAHAAGIVHRDIKPENIMIRPDGYVKVLDFGLAKLVERKSKSFLGLEESTARQNQSAKGVILGTVNYMSPEQAKGERVDERTDIFSFGAVIYEMIAGRMPFAGDSIAETLANLINAEPQPLSAFASSVPDELKRIVSKTLRKNKDDRYQTVKDLLADFKDLRQNRTVEEKLERLHSPAGEATSALQATRGDANKQTAETQDSFSQQIKRHKPLAAFALALLLIVSIGLGYYFFYAGRTARRGTTNEEAYRLYLQGRNLTANRTPEGARKAVEYFEQAIRLDPNFARAYSGMAHALIDSGNLGGGLPRVEYEKAKEVVLKALALDNNLAEGHAVLGELKFTYDWDFAGAEKDLLRAVELEPNTDLAHERYAFYLAVRGRFNEAIAEVKTAQEINPNSLQHQQVDGVILYLARRYDEAIIQFRRIIEVDENHATAYAWLWLAYEMKGDDAQAYEWFMKGQKRIKSEHIELFQKAYETSGWRGVRQESFDLNKVNEQQKPSANYFAMARQCALLGDKEQAFAYLNKGIEKRQGQMCMLNVEPSLDILRDDHRFDELVRRVGLK